MLICHVNKFSHVLLDFRMQLTKHNVNLNADILPDYSPESVGRLVRCSVGQKPLNTLHALNNVVLIKNGK